MDRLLVDVTTLLAIGALNEPDVQVEVRRQVEDLADELNSALDSYEVALVHLDTMDYLSFTVVDPTEGSYWREVEEERQEVLEDLALGRDPLGEGVSNG